MKGKALHMLRPAEPRSMRRETWCGRVSAGGGIGVQILRFSEDCDRHVEFEATEVAPAVTCKRCLKAMEREDGSAQDRL